ncbi:MAG: S41 family peptidase [Pseudomonadaceae bacterium]|nr:S41 family peptidase [Pseudomonadaceae bacterium]
MSPRPLILFGISLSLVTGVILGVVAANRLLLSTDSGGLLTLTEVARQIQDNYIDTVSPERLTEAALRGMVGELDIHSSYLDEQDYASLQAETNGGFVGIGVELAVIERRFTVVSPLSGSPAERAGLQAGDVLIEVDGESLKGLLLIDVIDRLRGELGAPVDLTLLRDDERIETNVRRDVVMVTSVDSRQLEDDIGYLRINQFQIDTADAFDKQLAELDTSAGLVLDLRNNPGGVLGASVAVADRLLDDGLIVFTEARARVAELRFEATPGDVLEGAPVVVLINQGSASASEIVAGALADHKRAILLGETSFGKASVQTVLPLSGSRAVKLTTARYFTPNGQAIHGVGITPHEELSTADNEKLLARAVALLRGL